MRFLWVALVLWLPLGALERAPWLGNYAEFENRCSYTYLTSSKFDAADGVRAKRLHNNQLLLSSMLTYVPDGTAELELVGAESSNAAFNFRGARVTARYRVWDDLVDNGCTITPGVTFGYYRQSQLHDLTQLQNAPFECTLHCGVGKQLGITRDGFWRLWGWGLGGLGTQRHASWIGGELHLDRVWVMPWEDRQLLGLFLVAQKGYGHRKPHLRHFHSYGGIPYRYADVGLQYSYRLYSYGSLALQVSRRLHGHFCPTNATTVRLELLVPLGL